MFRELLARVRDEVSGERALETVRALSRFHRIQSSPGYVAAAEWMAESLASAGLSPKLERFRGDGRTRHAGALLQEGWSCERGIATLVGARGREPLCDAAAEPLAVIQRSTPARGRFTLVEVGEGTEPAHYESVDVRGRVVLASGAVHRVHALAVLERGAAGILTDVRRLLPPVRGPEDDADAIPYTSFWWSEHAARGWGFAVSPRAGSRLRARLRSGEALDLDVELETRCFAADVPLVSASLEGPPGADEVLVLGHLCHPMPGANDNASGAAATLETARTLARLAARGAWRPASRTVRFLWMPEWNGTLAWLAADPARAGRIAAAVNLDMVGADQAQCGSTFLLEHPPHFRASFAEALLERVRREAQDWVTSYSGPGHYGTMRFAEVPFSGGSDHAVLIDPAFGVPCPMLIQWPDLFYHSSHDTPERCDPASLALAARSAATYAGVLAAADTAALEELGALVERDAERRLIEARDALEPGRTFARERVRGEAALASLARLGVPDSRTGSRIDAFRAAAAREIVPRWSPASNSGGGVPRRSLDAPLDLVLHMLPGFDTSSAPDRDRWRSLERDVPGGRLSLDLAWLACDGRRSLGELSAGIELESGAHVPPLGAGATLETFFTATAALGLSEWKEATHL